MIDLVLLFFAHNDFIRNIGGPLEFEPPNLDSTLSCYDQRFILHFYLAKFFVNITSEASIVHVVHLIAI